MGRGLSDLQKTILVTARANRLAEGLDPLRCVTLFDAKCGTLEPGGNAWLYPEDEIRTWLGWRDLLRGIGYIDMSEEAAERHLRYYPDGRPFIGELRLEIYADKFVGVVPEGPFDGQQDAQAIADRGKSAGVSAWISEVNYGFADLYQWEILISVYGFGEHRKLIMPGKPISTHFGPGSEHPGRRIPLLERQVIRAIRDRVETLRGGEGGDHEGFSPPPGSRPRAGLGTGWPLLGIQADIRGDVGGGIAIG